MPVGVQNLDSLHVNFIDASRTERCELWCYAVSEKSYALFTLDGRGEPLLRKHSAHVLGQYRSPIPDDRDGWILDAWKREIRAALGMPVEPFVWESYPAIAPLTLTTWSVFKPYRENAQLRPFNFLAVGVAHQRAYQCLYDVTNVAKCCEEPRPACPLFADVSNWAEQPWRCLRCGTSWNFDERRRLKTYHQVVTQTLQAAPRKRLCADGSEPTRQTRGLLIPRPVRVESRTVIGKEVIVDPTDTSEWLTPEMLSTTEVLEYQDLGARLDALRVAIRAFGVSLVARTAHVSRSIIKAFLNQGAIPQESTLKRLEAEITSLQSRK